MASHAIKISEIRTAAARQRYSDCKIGVWGVGDGSVVLSDVELQKNGRIQTFTVKHGAVVLDSGRTLREGETYGPSDQEYFYTSNKGMAGSFPSGFTISGLRMVGISIGGPREPQKPFIPLEPADQKPGATYVWDSTSAPQTDDAKLEVYREHERMEQEKFQEEHRASMERHRLEMEQHRVKMEQHRAQMAREREEQRMQREMERIQRETDRIRREAERMQREAERQQRSASRPRDSDDFWRAMRAQQNEPMEFSDLYQGTVIGSQLDGFYNVYSHNGVITSGDLRRGSIKYRGTIYNAPGKFVEGKFVPE